MSEHGHSHSDAFAQKEGRWAQAAEERISLFRHDEEIERGLAFGLPGSPTLVDRTIPTFSRGELPHFAGERGTFLNSPVPGGRQRGRPMPRSPSSARRWTPVPPTAPAHGSARRASAAPRTCSAPTATSSVSTCASS